jgi:SOS-response transcriptional repressor LexA
VTAGSAAVSGGPGFTRVARGESLEMLEAAGAPALGCVMGSSEVSGGRARSGESARTEVTADRGTAAPGVVDFALRIETDELGPGIRRGDVVGFRRASRAEDDQWALIETDGRCHLRKVRQAGDALHLLSEHPGCEPIVVPRAGARIVAVAVMLWRRLG